MKYIDAEKLRAEIERRMKDYNVSIEKYYNKQKSIKAERDSWKWAECKWFLSLITSLQQEQPSLPYNLDEAAKKIAFGVCKYLPSGIERDSIVYYAILAAIAGAEWMAGQISKAE